MTTETKTAVQVLNGYFNQGENKKPLAEFAKEIKALDPAEKQELAQLAAEALGVTLKS